MDLSPRDYAKIIAPPPVVLVSTLCGDVKNVAPFGMNMPVSHDPPMIALGIMEARDTFQNIRDVGEFVVAIPGPELIGQIDKAAGSYPPHVSEFKEAGLTPLPSKVVRPFRVMECQANLECRLEWFKRAGDHYVVVGKVVAAYLRDTLHVEPLSRAVIHPVYHVGARGATYAGKGPALS